MLLGDAFGEPSLSMFPGTRWRIATLFASEASQSIVWQGSHVLPRSGGEKKYWAGHTFSLHCTTNPFVYLCLIWKRVTCDPEIKTM